MDTEKIIDTTTYLYFDWKKIWWLSYHWHNSQHHVLPTILSSIHVPLKLIFFYLTWPFIWCSSSTRKLSFFYISKTTGPIL